MRLAPALAALALVLPVTAQAAPDPGMNGAPGPEAPTTLSAFDADAATLAAASLVAGRPVELRCETAEAVRARVGWALAYVVLDGSSVIHLGPTTCGWLAHPETPSTFGEGLLALVHEATHLGTNSVDESLVNCAALAAMPQIVRDYFAPMEAAPLLWGARHLFEMTPDSYRHCEEA